jgi:hypothetical protein
LSLAFDALSFPAMMEKFRSEQSHSELGKGAEHAGEALGVKDGDKEADTSGPAVEISNTFVHWKPFCSPWPKCVLEL